MIPFTAREEGNIDRIDNSFNYAPLTGVQGMTLKKSCVMSKTLRKSLLKKSQNLSIQKQKREINGRNLFKFNYYKRSLYTCVYIRNDK